MILFIALLALQSRTRAPLQGVITEWTGENGYEEYIQAAIAADKFDLASYRPYAQARLTGAALPPKPAWLPATSNHLDQDAAAVERFKDVFRLVRAGNEKAVRYPIKEPTIVTLRPELLSFRCFSTLFCLSSNWRAATGNIRGAGDELSEALEFCLKQPIDNQMQYAARSSCARILMTQVLRLLPRLSLTDCDNLADKFSQLIVPQQSIIDSFLSDQKEAGRTVAKSIAGQSELGWNDEWLNGLSKLLTKEDVDTATRYLAAAVVEEDRPILDVLNRPESEWGRLVEKSTPPDFAAIAPNASPLATYFALTIGDLVEQLQFGDPKPDLPAFFAHVRTQIRLMVLHLKIASYRWEFDRLPDRITNAADVRTATDPLTGRLFVYRRTLEGYELYSEGLNGKGRIDVDQAWKWLSADAPEVLP